MALHNLWISVSQPLRAGLTFGPGPTGLFQLCDLFVLSPELTQRARDADFPVLRGL
jgi:hypothetical protein